MSAPSPLHRLPAPGHHAPATLRAWLIVVLALLAGLASACLDAPPGDADLEPQARITTVWDPLACGDPHRVVVELEDPDGRRVSRSVPCELGRVTIDVLRWGLYRGRIYAWMPGPEIRAVVPIHLVVDEAYVYWFIDTPR